MTNVSNLLPWHPRRLDDEILSSWILRIAAGNNVSVRSLCAWLGNDQPVAALDRMAYTSPFIDSIAEAIGVEKEQVIECLPSSLHGLSRTPVYRPLGAAPMPWRLWQGSYGVMGNQYCPTCLGEKGHHQLPWSIAIYTCCLRHSCFLRESCPHCGNHFEVRLDFSTRAWLIQERTCNGALTAIDQSLVAHHPSARTKGL
ncbi:TniQ family protein [Tunturiibacter psychrotolerans]|uniref:TniQ family protein n=1 Tax=Tunturiibacter psychrotolerans TaxID=3069686 RepID=UPI00333E6A28